MARLLGIVLVPLLAILGVQASFSASYNITEQSADLCDAGSRYWTGTVQVSENKSMFFWYFESRRQPRDDPVILWLSGGPGATGELGLFKDIGPCRVNGDGNSTSRNEYGWTDHANVLFLDQPIGVGFSKVKDRDNDLPKNITDAAEDLETFLSIFNTHVFPELASKPWHFAGESFGGHYVTYYLHHMLSKQRSHSSRPIDVVSAIIVDGYIDATRQSGGYYDFFCQDWRGDGSSPLMSTEACDEMASDIPEYCGKFFLADVKPGGWNPYDSRKPCVEPPLCSDLDDGPALRFLNKPWVQQKMGFHNVSFELIDFDLNQRWDAERSLYLPTVKELSWILDETDVRVLFINGNNDIIVSTPGQMRLLDEQPWKRQAWFRAQSYQEWYYGKGEVVDGSSDGHLGGSWKGDERLSLYTIDEAGHTCPFDQPEAVGAVVRSWIDIGAAERSPTMGLGDGEL